LVQKVGAILGVASLGDLADYVRVPQRQIARIIDDSGLVPVAVEGWSDQAWADPRLLRHPPPEGSATALLSPFDNLIWDRKRTARLFGMDHVLEAYKPPGQRRYGYYVMPVLHQGRLIARVDVARVGTHLSARHVTVEPDETEP